MPRKKPFQPNQSLIDGLSCLSVMAQMNRPLGTRELARILQLDPTRTNRLLKTMSYVGVVEQNQSAKYAVGPGLHVLSTLVLHKSAFLQSAVLEAQRLMDTLNMGCAIGVCWEQFVCYLLHCPSPAMPAQEGIGKQALYPVTLSSIGRACLVHEPVEAVKNKLRRFENKVPPWKNWEQDHPRIRRRGFALGETKTSIAVAVEGEPTAGIALIGDFSEKEPPSQVIEKLKKSAARMSDTQNAMPFIPADAPVAV
jgi:DNA-binding IclR family transcriptional regulator